MDNIQVTGSVDEELMQHGILGYAGANLLNLSRDRKTHSFLAANAYWKVFVLYKPAQRSFHLPQDSVGIRFQDQLVSFTISDGVSIVNNTYDNQSGQVSLALLIETLSTSLPNYKKVFESLLEQENHGAATLQNGIVSSTAIYLDFFGSLDNLGQTYYLTAEDKLINTAIETKTFFPITLQSARHTISEEKIHGIIATSDGAIITEKKLSVLIHQLKKSLVKKEIDDYLSEFLPESLDDQSVVIISRSDS